MRLILLSVFAALGSVSALQMNVPASDPECIYEYVDANNKLKGSFEVLAGGLLDIDAEVRRGSSATLLLPRWNVEIKCPIECLTP